MGGGKERISCPDVSKSGGGKVCRDCPFTRPEMGKINNVAWAYRKATKQKKKKKKKKKKNTKSAG